MIYAGILAGGIGVRMHRIDLPKQFLMLGSKPIIIHTVEQFIINSAIDKIIIVVPENWLLYAKDLIKKWIPQNDNIYFIEGGVNKNESVFKITQFIEQNWSISDKDIIVTHDAIRPFLTQRIINENIEKAAEFFAVNTVMPTTDTIISSSDGEKIDEIPAKSCMYDEQTPQSFNIQKLKSIFDSVDIDTIRNETEMTRLFINSGNDIHLVMGEYYNIKIVTPYDLEVSNALLKEIVKKN
jgi:2-C-methyl-D-erythritol 4-phosphate cytidylyltransferase